MDRRLLILGLAVALTTVPMSTTAHHFSTGFEDTIGTAPSETPDAKSVPDDLHARGIDTNCYEADDELSAEEAQAAATSDGFCGELVYAEGTDFQQSSPVDQDLNGPVTTFDVVAAQEVDGNLGTCIPMCPGDVNPGGEDRWDAAHTAGSTLDLSHEPDKAREESGTRRFQSYGVVTETPWASSVVEQNVDAWEGNGWWLPGGDRSFVAFLEGAEGQSLGPDDLRSILDGDSGYPADAAPSVCGMSPTVDPIDFADTLIGLGSAGTACELTFEYIPDDSEPEAGYKEGYESRCKSETYICGATGGAYWKSSGYISGVDSAEMGSQENHIIWHWTVGHSQSDCQGLVEPGIDFTTDAGEDVPYLAHDLDVWVPITATNNADTVSQAGMTNYGDAVALADVEDAAAGGANTVTGIVSDPPSPAGTLLVKNDRVEPNSAEPVAPSKVEESSQQEIEIERSVTPGSCSALSNPETLDDPTTDQDESTVDPWVNIVDGELWQDAGALFVTPAGFYGNDDETQDDDNAPGPQQYVSTGKVGIFTDKDAVDPNQNDDGTYDQLGNEEKYNAKQVTQQGAYPMLWDMWADDQAAPNEAKIDETGGCERVNNQAFATVMRDAGYGPNTGLVQAIYLREPTTWTNLLNGQATPYPGGNNIYLQLSEGARDLYDEDPSTTANPMDGEIDELVASLEAYAIQQGANEETLEVKQPGQEFGLPHDWSVGQCTADTGGFTGDMSFLHSCQVSCEGDTIVTMYTFQVTDENGGLLGDGDNIPIFSPNNQPYDFGVGQHTWYDVDPFDGDPDRNRDESSAPPQG